MSVFTAGIPVKLTQVQLHRHAGGKDLPFFLSQWCYVLICQSNIAGSTGSYIAVSSVTYGNQAYVVTHKNQTTEKRVSANLPFGNIIRYQLSMGSRWLDVCHVFSFICVDRDKVEVHCNINEGGSQYPVILTKQPWPKKNLVWQESVGDPDPGILCSDWVVNQNKV